MASGQVMMYVAGEGGETQTYRDNLQELGLFQDIDPSNVFKLEDSTEFTMSNMIKDVEKAMSKFSQEDNSFMHAYIEGQSRMNNGRIELLLKDGSWYKIQEKMETVEQNNGTKWFAFNCPRRDEPRFSGLTHSGLAMKKATPSGLGVKKMKSGDDITKSKTMNKLKTRLDKDDQDAASPQMF